MHLLVDEPLCLEHIFGQHILEIFANTALELPAATVADGHASQALADIFAQRELLFVFVGAEGSATGRAPSALPPPMRNSFAVSSAQTKTWLQQSSTNMLVTGDESSDRRHT